MTPDIIDLHRSNQVSGQNRVPSLSAMFLPQLNAAPKSRVSTSWRQRNVKGQRMGVGDQAKKALAATVDKGIGVQQPTVERYIARAKQRNPSATPSEVIASLERQYLSTVIALGGASGASAAAPAVGTGAGLIVNIAEVGAFVEASALFSLAVAEVHGVQIDDLERRRTLLMAVLMGNGGSRLVEKVAGRTGPHWAKSLVKAAPMARIDAVNKVLGPRFITKYGTKQGVLVLGRDLPYGIGAAIGAGGNAALGRMTVSGARRAFGPPPQDWPAKPGVTLSPG